MMEVYIPRLERIELDDELEPQELSQEVAMMRDGTWVVLYNNKVEHPHSFLEKGIKKSRVYIKEEGFSK